jgi:hypothetical protein
VREQVERLLASPHFRSSRRCQALLRYVVDAYLDHRIDSIKERTIGFEVFQRDPAYDTNHDSVVRTTAAEVRKKLAQYYLEPAHEQELRVSLSQGSYVPDFRMPVVEPPAPEIVAVLPRRRRWPAPVALAAVLLAAGVYWRLRPRPTELDLLWKPLIEDRAEVVLCVGQPLRVYIFEGARTDELNEKMVGGQGVPPASADVRRKITLNLADLKSAGDRYFSSGDYLASVRVAEWLGQKGKTFQVLGDRNTGYKDLRGRPAVLIGQFDNPWTVGLTANARYYLARNSETYSYEVRDRQTGGVIGSVTRDANRPEEYAIITRTFDGPTEKAVIAVAGMTYKGTIAAGDFLTDPRYMREALEKAPADWTRKNIEVVVKTTMVAGTAGPPKVFATYFW